MKKKGFTLIELLVVIAIIGVLATFAVISFSNARAKARDMRTISNLNQIKKALQLCYDKIGSFSINTETAMSAPCYRESVTDGDFLASWNATCGEFLGRMPTRITGTYEYAIHTTADYQHVVLLAQLETSQYAMSNVEVTSLVQSLGMGAWTQCPEYNYAIGL